MTNLPINHSSILTTQEQIKEWLNKMKIYDFEIKDDLTVNVFSNVNLYGKKLQAIPIQFGFIEGSFLCGNNNLMTLKGCPHTINGNFSCASNQLTTLEDGPKIVTGQYYCMDNQLISLKGSPNTVYAFNCSQNQLPSLEFGPNEVASEYICSNNQLTSLKYSPKIIEEKFYCNHNKLTTLLGGPEKVKGRYQCSSNQLINLLGVAQELGELDCSTNPLTSLKGLPKLINEELDISNTLIKNIDVEVKFKELEHYISEGFTMLTGFESLYRDASEGKELHINYETFHSIQIIFNEKKQLESTLKNNITQNKKLKV